MNIFAKIREYFSGGSQRVKMVTERGDGFYGYDGKLYYSDVVRAAIRPKVKAVGKLVAKHIRDTIDSEGNHNITVNPDAYMRFLLEEPNPYMSGQKLQEKLAAQLILNKNAFALIIRDINGYPVEIYPVPCVSADTKYDANGRLYLIFTYQNGKSGVFPYSDIIHLREDYNERDIFGSSIAESLKPLMDVVTVMDQGIIKAIKSSAVIRWLLKYSTSTRPEDIEAGTKKFAESFLSVENGTGVAGVDSKAEAIQVHPDNIMPNASLIDRTIKRIYSLLNTNDKIVTSSYTENEWNSYFDAEIEPVLIDLKNEYTRKLFTRKERGFGNKIVFEASSWDNASLTTKLALMQMVDRGAMTPNEWRNAFNLAPLPGGDTAVRRLDTAPVSNNRGGEKE